MIYNINQCTLAVLAGGKSLRYPPNKLLVPWKGKPLIFHTLSRIIHSLSHTIIVASDNEVFSFLQLPVFTDIYPNKGPLGGIHTALHFSTTPFVWIVAGDMIYIDPKILNLLLEKSKDTDCVIPINPDGQFEPLCGLYRKTCLSVVDEIIQNTENPSVLLLYKEVKVKTISWRDITRSGLTKSIFTNINIPDDLLKL